MEQMVGLALRLLGGLALSRDGQPLTGFKSQKGQALLCYLAVTGQSHSRSALAGLLWPDIPEANARTNLRKVLTRLPEAISDHLVVTRQTIGLNPDRPMWVDVVQLEAGLAPQAEVEVVRQAVALYEGDFLAGFSLWDAPTFDEWAGAQRARLRQGTLGALQRLTAHFAAQEAYDLAIDYGRQLLAIEPWQEETHRQLMRLLAMTGQRSAALDQYEACRQLLQEGLGLAPAPETEALYRAIQSGDFSPATGLGQLRRDSLEPAMVVEREAAEQALLDGLISQAEPPAFMADAAGAPAPERPPIVNRERELARLQAALAETLAGRGGLVFLSGEAGAGKTALADEFA
ncbi:MAG: AAA family ATPase, partial [Chloroflexota bacterium]